MLYADDVNSRWSELSFGLKHDEMAAALDCHPSVVNEKLFRPKPNLRRSDHHLTENQIEGSLDNFDSILVFKVPGHSGVFFDPKSFKLRYTLQHGNVDAPSAVEQTFSHGCITDVVCSVEIDNSGEEMGDVTKSSTSSAKQKMNVVHRFIKQKPLNIWQDEYTKHRETFDAQMLPLHSLTSTQQRPFSRRMLGQAADSVILPAFINAAGANVRNQANDATLGRLYEEKRVPLFWCNTNNWMDTDSLFPCETVFKVKISQNPILPVRVSGLAAQSAETQGVYAAVPQIFTNVTLEWREYELKSQEQMLIVRSVLENGYPFPYSEILAQSASVAAGATNFNASLATRRGNVKELICMVMAEGGDTTYPTNGLATEDTNVTPFGYKGGKEGANGSKSLFRNTDQVIRRIKVAYNDKISHTNAVLDATNVEIFAAGLAADKSAIGNPLMYIPTQVDEVSYNGNLKVGAPVNGHAKVFIGCIVSGVFTLFSRTKALITWDGKGEQ